MSVNWKYIANTITKGLNQTIVVNKISTIEMTDRMACHPPIYKWTVRLNNGHIIDLHNRNLKNINELTKEDEKALYEAWKNDEELKKKGYEEIKTKLF